MENEDAFDVALGGSSLDLLPPPPLVQRWNTDTPPFHIDVFRLILVSLYADLQAEFERMKRKQKQATRFEQLLKMRLVSHEWDDCVRGFFAYDSYTVASTRHLRSLSDPFPFPVYQLRCLTDPSPVGDIGIRRFRRSGVKILRIDTGAAGPEPLRDPWLAVQSLLGLTEVTFYLTPETVFPQYSLDALPPLEHLSQLTVYFSRKTTGLLREPFLFPSLEKLPALHTLTFSHQHAKEGASGYDDNFLTHLFQQNRILKFAAPYAPQLESIRLTGWMCPTDDTFFSDLISLRSLEFHWYSRNSSTWTGIDSPAPLEHISPLAFILNTLPCALKLETLIIRDSIRESRNGGTGSAMWLPFLIGALQAIPALEELKWLQLLHLGRRGVRDELHGLGAMLEKVCTEKGIHVKEGTNQGRILNITWDQ